jgi:chromosome segregation ATPase
MDPQTRMARQLERQGRDCEAQLSHARREQNRIRRKLQTRLLTMTLEHAESQRNLEARLDNALAELNAARAERDRTRQDLENRLANAMVERTRMEKNYERRLAEAKDRLAEEKDRLVEESGRRFRLESELKGVYASLSWRLTAPLRWLNTPFARWKRR